MFTGKDGERILNTGLANIRDTKRKLATYCGFELAIYRIISPDIFFFDREKSMYGDCMRLNEGLNDAAIFFSYEVTSSE